MTSDERYTSEEFADCEGCGARPTATLAEDAAGGYEAVVGCPECAGRFVKAHAPRMFEALNRAKTGWNHLNTEYE